MAMHLPDTEIELQVAIAWHPRHWVLLPKFGRIPAAMCAPAGFRSGWFITWWFLHVQRRCRYV